jgi:protein-L-isoaspartate O-methyltransferase
MYAKYVLPRLINLAMKSRDMTRLRSESVPQANGNVLEIGIGSGLNLPFYSSAVQHVYGVDPSLELQRRPRRRRQVNRLMSRSFCNPPKIGSRLPT